jgi:uncharacterized protein
MNGTVLLALQRTDTAINQLAYRRAHLPEVDALRSAERALAALQAAIAARHRDVAEAEAAIETAEHSAAAITVKRTRLEGQLKTVIAAREAEALMHEIALLNDQRGALDDDELAAMEQQSGAEQAAAELAAQVPSAEVERDRSAAILSDAQAVCDAEAAQLGAERASLAASLSATELSLYDAARARFGGIGIVGLDGTHCSGCHLDISRGELDAIKALPPDELAECPQCARYLVRG